MRRFLAAAMIALAPAGAAASPFSARLMMEMEYLGQSYYNEAVIDLPASDLPTGRLVETTSFAEGIWLPGQRLDLRFDQPGAASVDLRSSTGWNARRFFQEFDGRIVRRGADGGGWTLRARGLFRDDKDSYLGRGDWNAGLEARRDIALGADLGAILEARVRHSRSRGDAASFVFDYDRLEVRGAVQGGRVRGNRWQVYARGVRKTIPAAVIGEYNEAAAGGFFRGDGNRWFETSLDVSRRDYAVDGDVGRDVTEVNGRMRWDLWRGGDRRLRVEADLRTADYRGADALYFDFGEAVLHLPWEQGAGVWSLSAGPRMRWLRDFSGGTRDYGQWGLRTGVGRSVSSAGFAQVDLDVAYRDYAAPDPETVELDALSTVFLRSDFWLVDVMFLADIPLMAGFSLDVLVDSALEMHTGEAERIHLTFATVSVVRAF